MKNKSAMQELIELLHSEQRMDKNSPRAIEFLEIEKKQIIDAYNSGNLRKFKDSAEQYYTETFNHR